MQAANDNHEQRYAAFNNRLSQFMRGERTAPASMNDEEWAQYQSQSELKQGIQNMRCILNPVMRAI